MTSRLKLVGSEAFRSIGANLSTSFAATMTVLIGKEIALSAILDDFDATSSEDVQALGFSVTALILIVVGLAVGAVGSGLTLRRYLKV